MGQLKYENGKVVEEYSKEQLAELIEQCQAAINVYQTDLDNAAVRKKVYEDLKAQLEG